ncbi:MAG: autotransporter outer membrane beta-barrel domain-containing protein, partial [Kiloniellales bacterium]
DGGGGAALGGAIFVRDGGSLTLSDVTLAGSYSVTAGGTGRTGGATAGQAQGRVVFLHGTGATDLNVASGSETLAGADALAGDGTLIKNGAGTLAITGANADFLGSVTLTQGTLSLGDSTALGTAGVTVNGANSTLAYGDGIALSNDVALGAAGSRLDVSSGSASHGGDITESGGARTLEKTGAGTLILTGDATHTGGTTISAGTLQIGDGGTIGSLSGNVTNNATLAFNRSDAIVFGGSVSGTGGLTQAGSGTLTLTGDATHTGGTTISAGTLRLGAAERLADGGAVTVTGGATFDLAGNDETIGLLSGGGGVTLGAGTLTTGGAGNSSFSGAISGSGGLTKTGVGTLTLTGANSYSGGTTISAGTLQVGDGGTSGSLAGNVTNNAALTFDRSDAIVFGGVISGSGGLTKAGGGSLTLTGTSSFTGGTAVTGGTLIVNGTLGDVNVGSGTILGGVGSLGALTANGRVAPGNSIGTLSSGPVTFNPGSVLAAEIAPDGSADLLDVTGTATINGGRVEIAPQAGNYSDGQQFLILQTTAGVTGVFDTVGYAAGQALALLDPSLLFQGNDVRLLLSRNSRDFEDTIDDPDLKPTGRALDALEDDPTPTGGPLIRDLLALTDAELNEATRQLSGSGLTGGAQLVQLAGQSVLAAIPGSAGGGTFTDTAGLTQFALAETGANAALDSLSLAAAAGPDRLQPSGPRFWFEGLGGFGARDADGAADGQNRFYAGAAGGVVFPLAEELELGLALAGFGGQVKSNDGLVETETTSLLAAAKLTWAPGPWQVSGSFGLAGHSFESERDLRFAGFDRNAEGERDGYEVLGDLSVGYDWEASAWGLEGLTLTPTAGLAASWLYEEAWEESGAAGANLKLGTARTLSLQPRLGFGVATDVDLGEGLTLTPRGQALWIARLGDEGTDTTARFAGTTSSWRVPGLDEPDHAAALSLGADLASQNGWALSAGYAGRFGDGARDHGLLLGGRLSF